MSLTNEHKGIQTVKNIMGQNASVVTHPEIVKERMNRLPLGIFILFLCVVGIVGNSLVLNIFRKIQYDSTYKIFVFILAYFDLSTSFAHLMKEVEQLWFPSYDTSDIECRVTYFTAYTVSTTSYCIIFVIAIERYRKICHPLKSQMSVSFAKRICLACFGFACMTGLPFPFMVGNWYTKMEGRTISQCMIGNVGERKVWPFIYNLSNLTTSVLLAIIVVCLQVIIWKTILAQKAARKKLRDGQNFGNKNQDATSKDSKAARRAAKDDNVKITLTFCIITALLIVSYFPLVTINTLVAYKNYYDPYIAIDRSTYVLFGVLAHFGAINSILNPFVYFFSDNRFRDLFKEMLC